MSTSGEVQQNRGPKFGPSDTSPEAQRVFDDVHRRLSPWRKWAQVDDMYRFTRQLHEMGARLRRPGATAAEIRDDWMAIHPREFPAQLKGSPVIHPPEMRRVVREVTGALDALSIAYAVGGSIASSIHGIGRSTIDADLAVEPFPGREETFVARFGPEYYVSLDAVRQAVRDRSSFNIISTYTGIKVDVFVRKDRPFEQSVLQRRVTLSDPDNPGDSIQVVSPEDIVLLKLEWFRIGQEVSDRQWNDVVNVLRIRGDTLDREYLARWAAEIGVGDLLDEALAEANP